ncbi:MAG: hypothetical protein Kow00121_44570 [Elainellaceae cyanobacterium]
MNTKYEEYHALELIAAPMQNDQPSAVVSWLTRLWKRLSTSSPCSSMPFIWKSMDAAGNICWNVFDRLTGQTIFFMSEEQFWCWLERRYH